MQLRRKRSLVGRVECVGFPFRTPGNWFGIDTETTGLDPWGTIHVDRAVYPARAFAFSLCNADGECAYIRWQVDAGTREVLPDKATSNLLQELLGKKLTAVFFNAPYDYRMLRLAGFKINCLIHDCLIGQSVVNPDEFDNGLKALSKKYLGIPDDDEKMLHASIMETRRKVQAQRRRKEGGPLAHYALSEDVKGDVFLGEEGLCRDYTMKDALRTATLHIAQLEHLDEDSNNGGRLWDVYNREHKVMRTLRRMEDRGTCIDRDRNLHVISFYKKWTAIAQFGINVNGGKSLNPRSPKQMTKHFFQELGHAPLKYSTKKVAGKKVPVRCQWCKGNGCGICQMTGNNPKCDGDFLQHIGVKHEEDESGNDKIVMGEPLAYWMLYFKAAGTMIGYTEQYRDLSTLEDDNWILHPNYKQVEAVTGRMSCERPNLQNVASDESGKKRVDLPYKPRECFVPRPGHIFYVPDYSQIEVWIFALLSKDKTMLDTLYGGGDFHGNIASLIWGSLWDEKIAKSAENLKPHEMSSDQKKHLKTKKRWRKRAKNVMFTKLYGGGLGRVAETIGCSTSEAEVFVDQYDERLPGVRQYMHETIGLAKRQGYVINPFGRRYPIHRDVAYKATNYLIQGTAAEVMKNGMVRVDGLCQKDYLDQMYLLLQIHDELIVEVAKEAHSIRAMQDVVTAMSADYKELGCKIPFPVGMKIAEERWSECQDVLLKTAT